MFLTTKSIKQILTDKEQGAIHLNLHHKFKISLLHHKMLILGIKVHHSCLRDFSMMMRIQMHKWLSLKQAKKKTIEI